MQKIVIIVCLLSAFLFANKLDIDRIKQGDFTQLQEYLKNLESISKQRDLDYNEYKMLARFAPDHSYDVGINREFGSIYSSGLSLFLAKEFGDLFAQYGISFHENEGGSRLKYGLYDNVVFWFSGKSIRDYKQVFTTQRAYESFLFFKHNAMLEGSCEFGDGGGGICGFDFKKSIKAKGILTLNADFSLPPNKLDMCSDFTYSNTFETEDSRLDLINGGRIVLDNRKYYNNFIPLLPKWYKDGFGGSVSYEVEVEIEGVSSWTWSGCEEGKTINIANIKVLKMLQDNPDNRKDYAKKMGEEEFNTYKLALASTDTYINLRDKPNGRIIEQIPTAKSNEVLLLNLNMSLWEIAGVNEWQRQLGYKPNESSEFSDFYILSDEYKEVIGKEWIKVLYFPPNTQKITEAKVGYIYKSQLTISDPSSYY